MTPNAPRVLLLIGDSPSDVSLFSQMSRHDTLRETELVRVYSMAEAEQYLAISTVDAIVLDLNLPDSYGIVSIQRVHASAPHVPVVALTTRDDEVMAAQVLRQGAEDFLIKDQIDARGLIRAARHAIERKAMQEALFAEKERAQVTLNSIGEGVICTDITGNITFLNSVSESITGWTREHADGRPLTDVFRILDAATRQAVPDGIASALYHRRITHSAPDRLLVRRDKSEVPIEDSIAPIHDRDGRAVGAVIIFRDVSEARSMAVQLAHAAHHDFLTGLPNRMLLHDRIRQAITLAARNGEKVAVLFLDLDGFKHINDSLGHAIGDELLKMIAHRLSGCVRSSDTVSRQGGDEFLISLAALKNPEHAAITARKMLKAVADSHAIERHDLHITASIGISVYPDDALHAEALIQNADTAMYQAKENGCHSYQFFKPAMNVRAVERQSVEEGLRRAMERNELVLHYQPQIDLITGKITGAEALLRWTHPTRGAVPPAKFIPVAEDCGLILPIGKWALREACKQARIWSNASLPLTSIAVNISATQFRDEGFLDGLVRILDETGLDPRFLELELTEGVLMKRVEQTESVLRALKMMGVRLAVDDFGTGYSSLSYLTKFPLDALKIDQSFVHQISIAPTETTVVTAIINMGRSLKLRVIAEGVETHQELAFLKAHRCHEAQGFYFSRPLSAENFGVLLSTGVGEPVVFR
jgi:diguanylate cyclase (GGDEF)-like protein/PAS domain S-box-containing protein